MAHLFDSAAAPFWIASALGILNVLSVSLFLPETHHNRQAEHHFHFLKGIQNILAAWRDTEARPVYISSFLYASGFTFFTSFVGILLVARFGLDESAIGTFFGVNGIWIVVTQLFILRFITKWYDEKTILKVSLLVLAVTLALYPFISSVVLLYALAPLLSIPNGLSMANMGALVSKSVSPKKQGAALGINGSLMALSQGTVPLLAGGISGLLGLRAPFLVGTSLIILAWFNLFIFSKRK